MIRWQDLPLTAILFTHFEDSTGLQTDIAVSELEKSAEYAQLEEVLIPIIPAHMQNSCSQFAGSRATGSSASCSLQ